MDCTLHKYTHIHVYIYIGKYHLASHLQRVPIDNFVAAWILIGRWLNGHLAIKFQIILQEFYKDKIYLINK